MEGLWGGLGCVEMSLELGVFWNIENFLHFFRLLRYMKIDKSLETWDALLCADFENYG